MRRNILTLPARDAPLNPSPQILVGCNEKVVCIRVLGKGSFQNSSGVKQFAMAMIQRGHREFVVDLAECPVMDSTFMGTLTGVAIKLRGLGSGHLHVIHPNERNSGLLRGLGLDQILDLPDDEFAAQNGYDDTLAGADPQPVPAPADDVADQRRQTAETMLAAHQALIDADPGNLSRFKDVLDYLKQDLARGAGTDAGPHVD